MLALLTNQWRQRAAAFVVALYALCLLAPAAAFAMSEGAVPAHCLTMTDEHQAVGESYGHHHDGMDHAGMKHEGLNHGTPASGSDDHALPGKCCGLFCVTAIALPVFDVTDAQLAGATVVARPRPASLLGRNSGRIDRPPRFLTSL